MIGISFTTFLSSASTLDEMKGSSSAKKKISFSHNVYIKNQGKIKLYGYF